MSDRGEVRSYEIQFDYEYHVYDQLGDQLDLNGFDIQARQEFWQGCLEIGEEAWKTVDIKFPTSNQKFKEAEYIELLKTKVMKKYKDTYKLTYHKISRLQNVLRCVSFGILFVDQRSRKVLLVKNRKNQYSAPKGHPKWKGDQLESPLETAKRETKEELLITPSITDIVDQNSSKYVQHPVENDKDRLIGLYIVNIHKEDFSVKDCEWVNFDYISENPGNYGTLSPFVK